MCRIFLTGKNLLNNLFSFLLNFYRQFPLYNNDIRWQQPNPNPAGPYLAYPIIPAQPPVSTEYTYYQLMPAPCAQVMGFYHPFPPPYSAPFQTANAVNTVTTECTERPNPSGQVFPISTQRSRSSNRGPIIPKVSMAQSGFCFNGKNKTINKSTCTETCFSFEQEQVWKYINGREGGWKRC